MITGKARAETPSSPLPWLLFTCPTSLKTMQNVFALSLSLSLSLALSMFPPLWNYHNFVGVMCVRRRLPAGTTAILHIKIEANNMPHPSSACHTDDLIFEKDRSYSYISFLISNCSSTFNQFTTNVVTSTMATVACLKVHQFFFPSLPYLSPTYNNNNKKTHTKATSRLEPAVMTLAESGIPPKAQHPPRLQEEEQQLRQRLWLPNIARKTRKGKMLGLHSLPPLIPSPAMNPPLLSRLVSCLLPFACVSLSPAWKNRVLLWKTSCRKQEFRTYRTIFHVRMSFVARKPPPPLTIVEHM